MNAGGIWSVRDDVLTLTVQPYFYETWWFYMLCGLGSLGLVYTGFRYQVRQYKQRELSRLVEERTQALSEEKEKVALQAKQLKSLDEAKSRFFVNISHEFRTPLTLILSPLQDALSGSFGEPDQRLFSQLSIMQRNGKRLLQLINQLLNLAKLETSSMTLYVRRANVVPFIRHLVTCFASRAERQNITLQFHAEQDNIELYYEAEKLEAVVINLLSNAFKFTPRHGKVRVSVAQDAGEEGPLVEIAVMDTGRGIPQSDLPYIFDRFYRGNDASVREHEGTGVGLALGRVCKLNLEAISNSETRLQDGISRTFRSPDGVIAWFRPAILEFANTRSAERPSAAVCLG